MTIEFDPSLEVLNYLPRLNPSEIKQVQILSMGKLIHAETGLNLLKRTKSPTLLITGMPWTGKTTSLGQIHNNLSSMMMRHTIHEEKRPDIPIDFKTDYTPVFLANIAMATENVRGLVENLVPNNRGNGIHLFERGLVDQIAFANALNIFWGSQFEKETEIVSKFLGLFLPYIDGILILNSTGQKTLERGSKLPLKLLNLLNLEYTMLPENLAKLGGHSDIPIVTIDYDLIDDPENATRKSIYSLASWSLSGKIY